MACKPMASFPGTLSIGNVVLDRLPQGYEYAVIVRQLDAGSADVPSALSAKREHVA